MATKPVTAKLRLRLELIAALPEPIMLDRLRRLSVAELTAFRSLYGIRECRCKGRCTVQQFMLRTTSAVKLGRSRRLAAKLIRELRDNHERLSRHAKSKSAKRILRRSDTLTDIADR